MLDAAVSGVKESAVHTRRALTSAPETRIDCAVLAQRASRLDVPQRANVPYGLLVTQRSAIVVTDSNEFPCRVGSGPAWPQLQPSAVTPSPKAGKYQPSLGVPMVVERFSQDLMPVARRRQ